ncbi:MAG: sulfotransferase [Methylococcales bacterium]
MSHPDAILLNDQAFQYLDCGDRQSAKRLFEQVCSIDKQNSEAIMMLGVINMEEGHLAIAEGHIRQSLVIDPDYADAYYYLATIQQARGEHTEALISVEHAVGLDSNFSEAKKLLHELKQSPKSMNKNQAENHKNTTPTPVSQQELTRADGFLQQGQLHEAIKCFVKVTECQPDLSIAWFLLGRTHAQLASYAEAERCCKEAIRLDSELIAAHLMLATIFLTSGNVEEADKYSNTALQLAPEDVNAVALAANIAKHMGEPQRSYDLLSPMLEQGVKQVNIALAFSMISKDLGRQRQAIDLMEDILLSDPSLNATARCNLHFNLGMLYDNTRHYDLAFQHYQQGNELKSVSFDPRQYEKTIDNYIDTYNMDLLTRLPRANHSSKRPVFIIGMVRSGTSLVEQILRSHPAVFGAGELGDIYTISNALSDILQTSAPYPECVAELSQLQMNELAEKYLEHLKQISPGAEQRVTNKLPGNYMHLGLIELMFPNAYVIHCKRNPLDTCLSAYFQDFSTIHPYSYALSNLGIFYKGYLKLMAHWRKVLQLPFIEINYEDLIAGQEQVSRKLVNFLDLEWDDSCLSFHKTEGVVRTASYDQVNKPLYNQSVARWKNYESHLQPLLTALEE